MLALSACTPDRPLAVSTSPSTAMSSTSTSTRASTTTRDTVPSPTTVSTVTTTTTAGGCAPVGRFGPYVLDLHFLDAATGWAAGTSTIRRTRDGGATWAAGCMPEDFRGGVMALDFRSERGWAVGEPDPQQGLGGRSILRTTDGGDHWVRAKLPPEIGGLSDIAFLDDDHGLAVGRVPYVEGQHGHQTGDGAVILRSADGGRTWAVAARFEPDVAGGFRRLFVLDEHHAWALGQTRGNTQVMAATTDGGATWARHGLPEGIRDARDTVFVDEHRGWLVAHMENDAVLYSTADGGANWTQQQRAYGSWWDLHFTDDRHGWVIGGDPAPVVLATRDGGATWATFRVPGQSLTSIIFTDSDHGFAAGQQGACLYATSDGGVTWASRPIDARPEHCA